MRNSLVVPELTKLISESKSLEGKIIDLPRTFNSKAELQAFYKTYGYVTLKSLIPLALLQSVREDLISIFGHYGNDAENPVDSAIIHLDAVDRKKLYELHMAAVKCTSFKAISGFLANAIKDVSGVNKPVLEIASGFLLSIAKDNRLVYNFHQESNYMKGFDEIFNVHYPLFRTSTTKNGTMSVLPGSHQYGTLSFEKNRISNDSYTDLIPSDIESITQELPEFHCYLELGDCVIFHKDLIHRSNHNGSDLCRPVGVSRFTQSLVGEWVSRKPEDL